MQRLYILKNSKGNVIYNGPNKSELIELIDPARDNSYEHYEFGVYPDLLRIRTVNWINDASSNGKFRQRDEPSWIQISGAEALKGLLRILQPGR